MVVTEDVVGVPAAGFPAPLGQPIATTMPDRQSGFHPHTATGTAGFGRRELGLSSVGEQPVTSAVHRFDGDHPEWDVDLAPQ